eukprot:scaffold109224_cov64-Cyclotella_meneghiniana.AAC.4
MTNERESVRVSSESILLLLYAWNSAPVAGTDIPRSLVVTGRVFHFPIDYSTSKHLELTSSAANVTNYARDQAQLLSASREIAKVLLDEHRSWHREYVNRNRPNPRIYDIGDIVFAQRATKSDATRGRVGKLMYPMTGPWRITEKLPGASYRIEHCHRPSRTDKKHASMLSPFPLELVPFAPIDGPDTRFSQLYRPISKSPYHEAGISGFKPSQPFSVQAHFSTTIRADDFYWPTVSELNEELAPFPWQPNEEHSFTEEPTDSVEMAPLLYTGPPPAAPTTAAPSVPEISTLAPAIINSQDKLFFISLPISTNYSEWRLVRVAFADTMSLHPACLQDGKFLVDFYISHTDDIRYNNINQRFWLQYHYLGDIISPTQTSQTHLIRPSDTSESLAARRNLRPFRQWINLTHESSYIHGPFEFATINGRKTRDRISLDDWRILSSHSSMFHNAVPDLTMPSYSIHVDRGVTITTISNVACTMLTTLSLGTDPASLYR